MEVLFLHVGPPSGHYRLKLEAAQMSIQGVQRGLSLEAWARVNPLLCPQSPCSHLQLSSSALVVVVTWVYQEIKLRPGPLSYSSPSPGPTTLMSESC